MPMAVHVAELKCERSGRMTATVVIQPSDVSAFRVSIAFDDKGSDENNLHHVQAALQRFSSELAEALRRPLKIARRPAART